MSFLRFLSTNRKAKADPSQSSMENDRPPPYYTSNVTTAPYHTLTGRDSGTQPGSSLTDTLNLAEKSKAASLNYIYYRIYSEDGAIPSKTPVAAGNPFVGRIKIKSVPPPRTAKTVKCCIATVENIKDGESTSLYLTPSSQLPMGDTDKNIILNGTGPGSTPQEPLALVAKMSDSERSALESDGRGRLTSVEADATSEIRYVYYLLYANNCEAASKVAIDPEEPSLGRIPADSVAPPHSPTSIKRCISRVEKNPALVWHSDLFADTSCDTPLKEGRISILRTDGPGLSPNNPMAIVQVKKPSIPDGKYVIKNRAADFYWWVGNNPITMVYFFPYSNSQAVKGINYFQWNITQDANGNISMTSLYAPSSWVGAGMAGSTVPVPWQLIPADGKFFYLTPDLNHVPQNLRVPAAQEGMKNYYVGPMTTLKEGDQWQMWEFIPI